MSRAVWARSVLRMAFLGAVEAAQDGGRLAAPDDALVSVVKMERGAMVDGFRRGRVAHGILPIRLWAAEVHPQVIVELLGAVAGYAPCPLDAGGPVARRGLVGRFDGIPLICCSEECPAMGLVLMDYRSPAELRRDVEDGILAYERALFLGLE